MDEQMDGTGDRPEPRRSGRALQPRSAPSPGAASRPEAALPATEDLTARLARVDALERRLRTAIAAVEQVQADAERRLDDLEAQLAGTVVRLEERAAALEAAAAALAAATPPRLRVPPPPAADAAATGGPDAAGEALGTDDPEAAREEVVARVLEVEGIGPARARRVADAFGDLEVLAAADAAAVAELAGLPERAAAAILDHVRS